MDNIDEKIEILKQEVDQERKKVSPDRMDISFGELINMYKNKELVIRPEYQRLFRWTDEQKTALIESILLSIPIPPIFVSEDNDGIWELVDGLQRTSTLISFFGELDRNISEIEYVVGNLDSDDININEDIDVAFQTHEIGNKWTLTKGGIIKSLEGFNIDNFPSNLKINLKRATCRVEILRGDSTASMKYELFKRLNSGGSKATAQEIRNAVFRGVDTRLNELLLKLSQNDDFISLSNLSKRKKQEMYDQELVLKFIAYLNNVDNINDNTEKYLNSFMENVVSNSEFNYEFYEESYLNMLGLLGSLHDNDIFKNSRNAFVPAYFEGIMIGVAQSFKKYKDNLELLRSKITQLKNDEDFRRFSEPSSNSKSRIRKRLTRAIEIFSDSSGHS